MQTVYRKSGLNRKRAAVRNCRPLPVEVGGEGWAALVERFWSDVTKQRGKNACWLFLNNPSEDGRGRLWISGSKFLAPRIAWTIYYGEDPGQRFVLHKCDDPRCIRKEHLFLGDYTDNARDKCAKGRHHYQVNPKASYFSKVSKTKKWIFRGADNVRSKLTEAAVRELLAMPRYVGMYDEMAKRFGVSRNTIKSALSGKRGWGWLHNAAT